MGEGNGTALPSKLILTILLGTSKVTDLYSNFKNWRNNA